LRGEDDAVLTTAGQEHCGAGNRRNEFHVTVGLVQGYQKRARPRGH
jgi:hypothetical protein